MGDIRDQIDGYWDELEEPAEADPMDQLNKLTYIWAKNWFDTNPLWSYLAGKTKDYQGGQTITENFLYDPVVSTKNLKALGEIVSGNMGWDGSKYSTYSTTAAAGTEAIQWAYENYLALLDKGSTGGDGK